MEVTLSSNEELMPKGTFQHASIDPKRARFPCCIVWTPLPVLSWFVPFIGHIGICREDGAILDFAGPNFVSVDNFAFGATTRYIQIMKEQCSLFTEPEGRITWDDVMRKSTQEFQHKSYNLFTCNCHSYVANILNRLSYGGHGRWNVVNIAALIFLNGKWVNKTAFVRAYLPFVLLLCIGLKFGGWSFLFGLTLLTSILVSWFLIASYCSKNLIQL